jgi:hypothetical protein
MCAINRVSASSRRITIVRNLPRARAQVFLFRPIWRRRLATALNAFLGHPVFDPEPLAFAVKMQRFAVAERHEIEVAAGTAAVGAAGAAVGHPPFLEVRPRQDF